MKQSNLITIVIFIIVLGWFYWYEWRPSQIRKKCSKIATSAAIDLLKQRPREMRNVYEEEAVKKGMFLKSDFKDFYKMCLIENGIEK